MLIRTAQMADIDILKKYDHYISAKELENSICLNRIYIIEKDKNLIGWLRYNLFWDSVPFMNMLYILDGSRRQGFGTRLVKYWESQMKELNYKEVMTSTQSNEYAQHFYYSLGYSAIGSFLTDEDTLELILSKEL
ncbi:MAG TPA: GNAT family N-acetyltransferase [Firmicutes bacterium]|nr:GNAT family N-acetyltransferase [Bacillota bacterium]